MKKYGDFAKISLRGGSKFSCKNSEKNVGNSFLTSFLVKIFAHDEFFLKIFEDDENMTRFFDEFEKNSTVLI